MSRGAGYRHNQRYNAGDDFEARSLVSIRRACECMREAFGRRYGLKRFFIDCHPDGDAWDVWMYERGPTVALGVTYRAPLRVESPCPSWNWYRVGLSVDSHVVSWEEELRIWSAIAAAFECRLIPWARERRIGCDRDRPCIAADPAWLSSTVLALARAIDADRAPEHLPVLADALEDAGCANTDVLSHCRGPGPHTHPCWVVDLLLQR